MGMELRTLTIMVKFLIIDVISAYNGIIDRPSLNTGEALVSILH